MHNNEDLQDSPGKNYQTASKLPNLNYLLATYLTTVFSFNWQFLKSIMDKYFNRLKILLKEKFAALQSRTTPTIFNNRKTKTFIKFSYKTYVIYFRFYFHCDTYYSNQWLTLCLVIVRNVPNTMGLLIKLLFRISYLVKIYFMNNLWNFDLTHPREYIILD